MESLKIYQFSQKNTDSYDFITVVAHDKKSAKEKVFSNTSTLGAETVAFILNGHCIEEDITSFIANSSDKAISSIELLVKK